MVGASAVSFWYIVDLLLYIENNLTIELNLLAECHLGSKRQALHNSQSEFIA